MNRTSTTGHPLVLLLAGALFAVLPTSARAGDAADDTPHLRYRPTYEQALLEARIRGIPLFISRHKDF